MHKYYINERDRKKEESFKNVIRLYRFKNYIVLVPEECLELFSRDLNLHPQSHKIFAQIQLQNKE